MKKRIALLTAVALLLSGLGCFTWAASKSVTVTLPGFPITINGKTIDNSVRKYPLIVYKDITYFPMTYYDCRFLGVETKYKKESGLEVTKAGIPQPYRGESGSRNAGKYTAAAAQFPVKVNGKALDSNKEEYPLLLFRNVTYFPLTYRFAAEEFDWNYSFDQAGGLSISEKSGSAASGASTVTEITLPIVKWQDGTAGPFTLAGDYFYYQGKKGKIYQAPVSQPSKGKEVYQLPEGQFGKGTYPAVELTTKNDQAVLTYHLGGPTMGSDYMIRLNDDGTAQQLAAGKRYVEDLGDYTVKVNRFLPPTGNNLMIRENGTTIPAGDENEGFRSLGEPGYAYGYAIDLGPNMNSFGGCDNFYLIGEDLYLAAAAFDQSLAYPTESSRVYSVNIKTGRTQQITKGNVADFQIQGNKLYFRTPDYQLYEKDLTFSEGGVLSAKETLLAKKVNQFVAAGDSVFYEEAASLILGGTQYLPGTESIIANTVSEPGQLFKAGETASVNPGGIVKSLSQQDGYVIASFASESASPYKLMVLNKDGKTIFRSSEETSHALIYKGKLIFVKE